MNQLVPVEEANSLIAQGLALHIAGEEAALRRLQRGNWIGGTIPYFLTHEGGVVERDRVFVTVLPREITDVSTRLIDIGHIPAIATEAPSNGFTLVIVPGLSDIHTTYGLTASSIPGIFETAVAGWVSGVHLDEIGKVTPKVFEGPTGVVSDSAIVTLRASLPPSRVAVIGTINVFEPGFGDEIVFQESSFSAGRCMINGTPEDFYDYAMRKKLDLTLPLISEKAGMVINTAFHALNHETRKALFYAPVMKGRVYHQAQPMPDYRLALIAAAKKLSLAPAFSCNCVLNYVHGKLEGDQFIPMPGPATFGEIAHVLANQTLVYLTIRDK